MKLGSIFRKRKATSETLSQAVAPTIEHLEGRVLLSTHRHGTSAINTLIAGGVIRVPTASPTGATPDQIRQLYNVTALDTFNRNFPLFTNTGDGQTIVVIGSPAPDLNDTPGGRKSNINLFKGVSQLTDRPVFEDPIPGFTPSGTFDQFGAIESTMQLEWAHAMAPHANLILVEVPSTNGIIASPDLEAGLQEGIRILQTFSVNGQINSVGAGGVMVTGLSTNGENATIAQQFDSIFGYKYAANVSAIAPAGEFGGVPSMPATSPFVTSVGGTVYQIDAAGNRISETASLQGGGGVSTVESLPRFQRGITVQGQALATRSGPDVALASQERGQGVSVYYDPTPDGSATNKWYDFEGTSVSAAIFAGMVADENELRASLGLGPIGRDLNNELYAAFKANPTTNFTDITEGSNTLYPAVKGFDLATGMGAPNAYNLLPALAGVSPHILKSSKTLTYGVNVTGDLFSSLQVAPTGNAVLPFTSGQGTLSLNSVGGLFSFTTTGVVQSIQSGVTTTVTATAVLTNARITRDLTNGTISGVGNVTVTPSTGAAETFRVSITGKISARGGKVTSIKGHMTTISTRGKVIPRGTQDTFDGDFST